MRWRSYDPVLFDRLYTIVKKDERRVITAEKSCLLENAIYSGERLDASKVALAQRHSWRENWFEGVMSTIQKCEIVFADPDNGLCHDDKFRASREKDLKTHTIVRGI